MHTVKGNLLDTVPRTAAFDTSQFIGSTGAHTLSKACVLRNGPSEDPPLVDLYISTFPSIHPQMAAQYV